MKRRNEGGALSAGSDVATAEIGHHGDTGQLGQQGGVADLHGEASGRFVAHGLPVTADGADLAGLQVLLSEQRGDALRGESRPAMLGQGGAGQFIPPGAAQRQQFLAQIDRHGYEVVAQQSRVVALLDQGNVQAIQAGSGHHTEIQAHA